MKKFLYFLGIILSCTTFVRADSDDYSSTLALDSKTLTISTTTASPTKILSYDSFCQRTWIVNSSTFTIFISSVSNNLSTSTSFGIPGTGATTNSPVIFSPDGSNEPFVGQLFAVANTQSPPSISIFRSK